jgi:hypothetical protein
VIWHVLWQMFDWPGGNVLGNLMASVMWTVPTWFIVLRKMHCAQSWCFRPGRHPVDGTTFHTCRKHTTGPVHEALKARHADKYPDQHAHLSEVKEGDHA